MGLKKIEIKTKATLYERKVTFSKRRKGLLNKAKELSVLCDVQLLLLFFSPTTEKPPGIFLGDQCNLQQMIERYAAVPLKEREQRKLDDFHHLKKLFEKQGKKFDAKYEQMCHPRGSSGQSELVDKQNHLSMLQGEIKEAEKALGSLRYLSDIDSIDDTNLLEEMERALQMHIHTLKIARDNGSDRHSHAMMEQAIVPQDWEALPSEESTQIDVNPYPPAPVFEDPKLELDLLYTDVRCKKYWGPPLTANHRQEQDHMGTTYEKFPENLNWMEDCLYHQQIEEAQRQSLQEAHAQYHHPPAAPRDPGASSSQPTHATANHKQEHDHMGTTYEEFPENPDWMEDCLYDQHIEEAQRQSLQGTQAQYHHPPAAPGDPGASSSQPTHATANHKQEQDHMGTTYEEFPENPDWMEDCLYDQHIEEAQRQSLQETQAQYHYPPAAPGDPGASSSQPPHST